MFKGWLLRFQNYKEFEGVHSFRSIYYSFFAITVAAFFIASNFILDFRDANVAKQVEFFKVTLAEDFKNLKSNFLASSPSPDYKAFNSQLEAVLKKYQIEEYDLILNAGGKCLWGANQNCGIVQQVAGPSLTQPKIVEALNNFLVIIPGTHGSTHDSMTLLVPLSEIDPQLSFSKRLFIYVIPFLLLVFLTFRLLEKKLIEPVLKRIIETEKTKAQQQVIRQFSHDIQSPIAVLEQLVESSDELPSESRDVISMALERVCTISKDMLDWDRSHLRVEEVFIRDLCKDLIRDKKLEHGRRLESIVLDIPNDVTYVKLNKLDFYRVLSNLVNNAVESMTEKVSIHINVSRRGNDLFVRVTDNGPGIIQDKVSLILEGEYSSKSTGNGLGVSGSKRWVEKMNGSFNIEPYTGMGTTIEINLPRVVC